MDVSRILDPLNPAQREAVSAPPGNLLVLAGAGSGKTRVLVHRIAWLIQVEHIPPWALLAVTFTNKAAREMRERIEHILEQPLGTMWVGTFHGLAHRLLRAHWQEARLPKTFQILDSDDQARLIKRIIKTLNLDEAKWPVRQAQLFISGHKDAGRRAQHLEPGNNPHQQRLIEIYQLYQEACEQAGQVDFAELLLRAHEILRDREDLLQHYQERFQHILVDEFQDTNPIQYAWLRLLAGARDNLFVVGDDDQSIYGWRGARVENLHQLQQERPSTRLLRLEQNYRSTGNILTAANALITRNAGRLGKTLWTQGGAGDPIQLYAAFNELDEAQFVVERIRRFVDSGERHDAAAILYRTTAQSRLFEEALIRARLPYRVYGGLRFFERAEIKDALAYLRLLNRSADDAAFERTASVPPKGIGPRTLDALRDQARASGISLWQAGQELLLSGALGTRAARPLSQFMDLMESWRRNTTGLALDAIVAHIISACGLAEHYEKTKDGKGVERKENLDELVNAARQFSVAENEMETTPLEAFLAHAALESGEAQGQLAADGVQLMTLHAAKGLEFPLVFLVGLEEDLFPHRMAADTPAHVEEERRLCYVGITRAKRQLYLTYAETRRLYGNENFPKPSRFLNELPEQVIEEIRPRVKKIQAPLRANPLPMRQLETNGLHPGAKVRHATFGIGVILSREGQGVAARVQVKFAAAAPKWLVLAYANLETVSA